MPPDHISHCRLVEKLGAGGMGVVYLAEDSRLRRKVALKLLPAQFTGDDERVRRFEQEARAASALNHPNIVTIYDIGHVDDGHFIAMEFVAGRPSFTRRRKAAPSSWRISCDTSAIAASFSARATSGASRMRFQRSIAICPNPYGA